MRSGFFVCVNFLAYKEGGSPGSQLSLFTLPYKVRRVKMAALLSLEYVLLNQLGTEISMGWKSPCLGIHSLFGARE